MFKFFLYCRAPGSLMSLRGTPSSRSPGTHSETISRNQGTRYQTISRNTEHISRNTGLSSRNNQEGNSRKDILLSRNEMMNQEDISRIGTHFSRNEERNQKDISRIGTHFSRNQQTFSTTETRSSRVHSTHFPGCDSRWTF